MGTFDFREQLISQCNGIEQSDHTEGGSNCEKRMNIGPVTYFGSKLASAIHLLILYKGSGLFSIFIA